MTPEAEEVVTVGAGAERYALIETATGRCVNVVLWNPGDAWQPPPGHHVERSDTREIDPDPAAG